MPRKKSKEPEDQELEQQFQEEQGSGEFAGDGEDFQEYAETMEEVTPESEVPDAPYIEGYPYGEEAPVPEPVPEETSAEDGGSIQSGVTPDGVEPEEAEQPAEEAEEAGYAALLQELSSSGLVPSEVDGAEPLTLEDASGEAPLPVSDSESNKDSVGEVSGTPALRRRSTAREPARPRTELERDRILTIDARDEVQTEAEREAILWHEIQNAHWTRRILTGTLDGVEQTESGMTVAAITYKGFRVAIPVKEMLLHNGRLPTGEEYQELMNRLRKILIARLGSEIDFVVLGHENKSRSDIVNTG